MKITSVTRIWILSVLMTGCSNVIYIESANQNSRVDYVVIHATSANFAESVRLLTTRTGYPVSAHYLIPDENDPTYGHRRLRLHQFVKESQRAWHAGVSYWAGDTGLNARSIGIEIVNEFSCELNTDAAEDIGPVAAEDIGPDALVCDFPMFSEAQIEMLIELLRGIQQRHPRIGPLDFVAHSDIAVPHRRRSDPGPLFPWRRLYDEGIGAWYDEETRLRYMAQFEDQLPTVESLQAALLRLGYLVEPTGELDHQTRFAVRAFQMHFRPSDYGGVPDVETAAILWSLIDKYRGGYQP